MNLKLARRTVLTFLWGITGGYALGQQETLWSQYMFNLYAYNPAYTGAGGKLSLNGLARRQWVDFPGAPTTFLFNANALICPLRSGIGFTAYGDIIGAFSIYNASLNYAFRIPVSETGTLALGINGGFHHVGIDPNKIVLANPNDVTYQPPQRSVTKPDLGAGLAYIGGNGYVGFSVAHILEQTTAVFDSATDSRLQRHYILTGGYDWRLSNALTVSASTLIRQTAGAPVQVDLNARALINRLFWAGLGYRFKDAFVVNAGVNINLRGNSRLRIGYAFDLTAGGVRLSNTLGSHEIFVNYSLGACTPRPKSRKRRTAEEDVPAPRPPRNTKTPENF